MKKITSRDVAKFTGELAKHSIKQALDLRTKPKDSSDLLGLALLFGLISDVANGYDVEGDRERLIGQFWD